MSCEPGANTACIARPAQAKAKKHRTQNRPSAFELETLVGMSLPRTGPGSAQTSGASMPLAPAFGTFGATTRENNETRTPPDKERFLRNNLFLRELSFTKKL